MKPLDPKALEYLNTQRVGVLAVEMPDGSPHSATLHFAYDADSSLFVFLTDRGYRKFEPLLHKKETRASLVIGTQEAEMKTVQMDGILAETDEEGSISAYRTKFTDKDLTDLDDSDVFIVFKPLWWRFTDWNTPEGKLVTASE